jgi:hypothetical protein
MKLKRVILDCIINFRESAINGLVYKTILKNYTESGSIS